VLPTDFHVHQDQSCEGQPLQICRSCLELLLRLLPLVRNHAADVLGEPRSGPLAADGQRARRGRAFRRNPSPSRRRRTRRHVAAR
jgi:hypothetical protein